MKIGVYFCECAGNISAKINAEVLAEKLQTEQQQTYFKTVNLLCSSEGKEFLTNDLLENAPDRVVFMACSPRDHEATFMRAMKDAQLNPYLMQMVNIREHISWVTEESDLATAKAWRYLQAAIRRVALHEPLELRTLDPNLDVLIIGAGPAGLEAALRIAEAGRKAIIVEKSPVIGGLPVRYEDVFPNIECGPCLLEPTMNEVLHGQHAENIELLTMAQLKEVVGSYGNFIVDIEQKPRFVDTTKCVGCGICIELCPATAENQFNCNLSTRKAISIPFEGALPYVPYIDEEVCLRFKGEDCQLCKESCFIEGVIDYQQSATNVKRNVGAIVIAIGAQLYDCHQIPTLGYHLPNVYTSLEFERIYASNGPYGGQIKTEEGSAPESVAIIHCAGSLEKEHVAYCSGICCSYALKFNHLLAHKLPETKIHHFFKEMVFCGKEGTSLLTQAKENPQASFVRYGQTDDLIISEEAGKTVLSFKDTENNRDSAAFDMVILCPPVIASGDAGLMGSLLEVSQDKYGFYQSLHGRTETTRSNIKGIYLAGTCQSPADMKDAINQGRAASGAILSGLVPGRKLEIQPITASVDHNRCSGCRICIAVCPYKAISFDTEKRVSAVNDILCQGCGTCVASCPSGVMRGNHFTDEEILAEIGGLFHK